MNKKEKLAKEVLKIFPSFMKRIHRGMTETGEIPSSQMGAVIILAEKKSCTLGCLSKDMGISAPTTTGIVDRLYKSGYVKRVRSKKDRRIVNITLTAKGKSLIRKIRRAMMQRWRIVSNVLSVKDQETHIRILKKIIKGFDEYYAK